MSMSKARKEAQDKLRKKYKYSTNTNYNRGVILYRGDESEGEGTLVTDTNILMNNIIRHENQEIYITMSNSVDMGKDVPECDRWMNLNNCGLFMTFEELELIYTVAKAMRDENDWPAQEKELKKRRKENERKNNQ